MRTLLPFQMPAGDAKLKYIARILNYTLDVQGLNVLVLEN